LGCIPRDCDVNRPAHLRRSAGLHTDPVASPPRERRVRPVESETLAHVGEFRDRLESSSSFGGTIGARHSGRGGHAGCMQMLGNNTDTDDTDRGQVGIGTLIVFIAMVLVAAIAAGVLINTAGSLQSQASDTGTETQQAVANQIEVTHAYGDLNPTGDNLEDDIQTLNLTIKKSAGSDVIDLNSMTVQFTSDELSRSLELDDDELTSVALADTDEPDSLVNTEDRIELQIDLTELDDGAELAEGDSATVDLVDQSGAQFTYGVTVPPTFGDNEVVEV